MVCRLVEYWDSVVVFCRSEVRMGGPYKRKKYHYGDTHLKKGWYKGERKR